MVGIQKESLESNFLEGYGYFSFCSFGMRKNLCIVLQIVFTVTTVLYPHPASAAPEIVSEYQVKAAYLYNFVRYTEWPAKAFSRESEMHLCVVGPEEMQHMFSRFPAKTPLGRPLQVSYFVTNPAVEDLDACHIVYAIGDRTDFMLNLIEKAADKPILTVEEQDGSAIISFSMADKKVQFTVNLALAEKAGISISSRMLKLAAAVKRD